jgi:hypothetical protein
MLLLLDQTVPTGDFELSLCSQISGLFPAATVTKKFPKLYVSFCWASPRAQWGQRRGRCKVCSLDVATQGVCSKTSRSLSASVYGKTNRMVMNECGRAAGSWCSREVTLGRRVLVLDDLMQERGRSGSYRSRRKEWRPRRR